MGRPKGTTKPDAKRSTVQVRVTDRERQAFERAADADGYSVPNWAREVLRRAAGLQTGETTMTRENLATHDTSTHSAEEVWNSVLGPYETKETVLAEAATQSVTPQDYVMTAIVEAKKQGFECDKGEAYRSLCDQLGITWG